MKKVLKYELRHGESLKLPEYHQVVHAGMQNGKPCLWAEVHCDQSDLCERSAYVICGTGHELPYLASHVKTFFDGDFVWHVYRVIAK